MNNLDTMKSLVNELNKASISYYTNDNPIMSDKEYDEMYNKLTGLQKETKTILPNSPTERIGDVLLKGFKKYTHQAPLWSLDKAQTDEELKEWFNRTERFVKDYNLTHSNKLPKIKYILTKKYDGITINSTYDKNGDLERTASRGTGVIGEVISEQAKTIVNLPHKIDNNFEFEIHGEALMNKRAFTDYNNSLKNNEKPLKNLRNGSAGALRNLNVKETARRKIITYMYDIGFSDGHKFETYIGMLDFIKSKGFPTAEYTVCNNLEEINKQIDVMNIERPTLQHDVDGVVIVVDDIKTRELMGFTVKFPKWGVAKKFLAEESTTVLLGIEWNVGRTGKIVPTGLLEPVELMGVTVKRATLNNMDDIKRKGVRINSEVFIRRSGDVIPEIMGTVDDDLENTTEIKMLKNCPSCGSEIIKDGVHYFCQNTLGCKPQLVKNITHFAERKAMNIEGISDKTIDQLMEANIVNTLVDLYKLKDRKREVLNLERFAIKKFNNMINSIEKSKHCKLHSFIYALGIDGIGEKSSKDITNIYDSIEKLKNAKFIDLLKIDDVGETTANAITHFFNDDEDMKLLDELLQYIIIEKEEINIMSKNKEGIFSRKKIYCTGTFASHKKEELKAIVESLGGEFANGYVKSLSYLVVGNLKGSTKTLKAEKDGVEILSEDRFLEMIREE